MALKYIPTSWRNDMRLNSNHKYNFYINPRGKVFPALTSTGISYIKNDLTTNMRGTYRMQCGASTSLTYLYTLPQRFIIEGWFKPEFVYDIAMSQPIINIDSVSASSPIALFYRASIDGFSFGTYIGSADYINTTAVTSTTQLNKWVYVRCFIDNIAKLKGFYCTINGVTFADSQNTPGAGIFTPANILSFFPAVTSESSFWIIHELDEQLATGVYKTYEADRQIIFDFNGTTLARERIRIPRINNLSDLRGVKSFSISKTGSGKANIANLSLYNINGQFSDDQYDAFDPFNGYYNGTQKYLQNRVGVEIESAYSRSGSSLDIPNGTTANYFQYYWATSDSWVIGGGTGSLSVSSGFLIATGNGGSVRTIFGRSISSSTGTVFRFKIRNNTKITEVRLSIDGGATFFSSAVPYTKDNDGSKTYSITLGTVTGIIYIYAYYASTSDQGAYPVYLKWVYDGDGTELTNKSREILFIGRTLPGAFSRNSPSRYEGMVDIEAEDNISELGETRLPRSYAYDGRVAAYKLSYPTDETLSLFHLISRAVTKHEIRNYALNSGFENATIGNSWLASGLTLTRDNTYSQFGTYSAKAVAASAGQYFRQTIKFETADYIDQGDIFNFSAFIRQGTASAVKIQIEELNNAGTLIGSASETSCGTDTGIFTRIDITRTILSSSCTELRITFYALAASTFYVDGVMLTRGIDRLDYYLLNANDGTSGIGSAENAATYLYDTIAFDADEVTLAHPYVLIKKGETAWEHLKDIGDATLVNYIGMSADGVLNYHVAYNSVDPASLGTIDDIAEIGTTLDINTENSIIVSGILIDTTITNTPLLWDGKNAGFSSNEGGQLQHPIVNGTYLTLAGASIIDATYSEETK